MKNHRLLRQSTAGFTLIETLVVVIMIGVLFAIAAPGWLTFINRQRLGTANEQILQTLRTAQAEARRTQTYREARFDVTADPPRAAVLPLTAGAIVGVDGAAVQTLARIPNAQVSQWETLGQGNVKSGILTFTTNNASSHSIIFSPDGAVASRIQAPTNPDINAQPFTVTLALRGAPSVKRCVRVRTLLGAVDQKSDADCP